MKLVAHLYISAREGFCEWSLEPLDVKELRVRGRLKLGTEVPLERIVELAGDHWLVIFLRVNASDYRIVSWPRRLHPRKMVLHVK